MADDDMEQQRQEVEEYLEHWDLRNVLNEAVNIVVKERPDDPLVPLSAALRAFSKTSKQILQVQGRAIFNTEGLPALEVEVTTGQGTFQARVSCGPYDEDPAAFEGKGVSKALEAVNNLISSKLAGMDPAQQEEIDRVLTKENAGLNATLAVSLACCRAGAAHNGLNLWEHIAQLANQPDSILPVPMFSLINGGDWGRGALFAQDILLVVTGVTNIQDATTLASSVHRKLAITLKDAGIKPVNRGCRGGYTPGTASFEEVMRCIANALAACEASEKVKLAVDVHASKMVNVEKSAAGEDVAKYDTCRFVDSSPPTVVSKTKDELGEVYADWLKTHPITTLIDPFDPQHRSGFKSLLEKADAAAQHPGGLGGDSKCPLQLVGDASVTSLSDITKANEHKLANTLLLTLSKGATVSGTIQMCRKAQDIGWGVVMSGDDARGEAADDIIADLATGLRAGQLRLSGFSSSSAAAACGRLARAAAAGVEYAGATYRRCT